MLVFYKVRCERKLVCEYDKVFMTGYKIIVKTWKRDIQVIVILKAGRNGKGSLDGIPSKDAWVGKKKVDWLLGNQKVEYEKGKGYVVAVARTKCFVSEISFLPSFSSKESHYCTQVCKVQGTNTTIHSLEGDSTEIATIAIITHLVSVYAKTIFNTYPFYSCDSELKLVSAVYGNLLIRILCECLVTFGRIWVDGEFFFQTRSNTFLREIREILGSNPHCES